MYEFNAIKIEGFNQIKILEEVNNYFLDKDYPEKILMINHLRDVDRILNVEHIRSIHFPEINNIYVYHERLKELYQTNYSSVCEYVEQLEPWEDVDLLIFNQSYKWFIAITHNDIILYHGLNDNSSN